MQSLQISSKDLRLAPVMSRVAKLAGEDHISCSYDEAVEICRKSSDSGILAGELKDAVDALKAMSVFEEIAHIGRALAELTGDGGEKRNRNAVMFAMRYGAIDIGERPSLEALAIRHGLTRERVRQILDRMLAKMAGKSLWTPAYDEAVASGSYTLMSEIEIYAFSAFAKDVLSTNVVLEKVKVRGRTVINNAAIANFTVTVTSVSQRLITRNGAAQTFVAYAMAASMSPERQVPSYGDFLAILAKTPDLVWIDEASGWYAFGDDLKIAKRNRIRNHLLKMLACAPKGIDVEEAFAQLGRYRERGKEEVGDTPFISIQPTVLKALMQLMPEVDHIGHDNFVLKGDKAAARAAYLSDVEVKAYEFMANNRGIASRAQVKAELVDNLHVGLPALTMAWERSPIFAALEYGICRLVGWNIEIPALEEARCTVSRQGR